MPGPRNRGRSSSGPARQAPRCAGSARRGAPPHASPSQASAPACTARLSRTAPPLPACRRAGEPAARRHWPNRNAPGSQHGHPGGVGRRPGDGCIGASADGGCEHALGAVAEPARRSQPAGPCPRGGEKKPATVPAAPGGAAAVCAAYLLAAKRCTPVACAATRAGLQLLPPGTGRAARAASPRSAAASYRSCGAGFCPAACKLAGDVQRTLSHRLCRGPCLRCSWRLCQQWLPSALTCRTCTTPCWLLPPPRPLRCGCRATAAAPAAAPRPARPRRARPWRPQQRPPPAGAASASGRCPGCPRRAIRPGTLQQQRPPRPPLPPPSRRHGAATPGRPRLCPPRRSTLGGRAPRPA